MNPFKLLNNNASLTDYFISQIETLKIGDTIKLDTKGRSAFTARPTLKYACEKISFKIVTRSDENELWIKRVA